MVPVHPRLYLEAARNRKASSEAAANGGETVTSDEPAETESDSKKETEDA